MNDEIKNRVSQIENRLHGLSLKEIFASNERLMESVNAEYQEFHKAYKSGVCYLCDKPFDDVDESKPCMHILLRRKKFKKELYKKVFDYLEYLQIASYLRWVANEDVAARNINDLKDECADNKVFNETIVWKNIEWTFDCSQSDFDGHEGSEFGNEPHWHFQMKENGFVFIKFNDFHIKFKDNDLITMSLVKDNAIQHTFGNAGMGMQSVMDFADNQPELFLNNSKTANECEEKAAVRVQSIISAPPGETFSGEDVYQAIQMSKRTGKTISACMQEILGHKCSSFVMVSPHDGVPEIAKRGKRK